MSQDIKYLEIFIWGYSFRYGIHESYSCRSPIMYDLLCTAWSQVDANSMTLIIKCFETTNKIARV